MQDQSPRDDASLLNPVYEGGMDPESNNPAGHPPKQQEFRLGAADFGASQRWGGNNGGDRPSRTSAARLALARRGQTLTEAALKAPVQPKVELGVAARTESVFDFHGGCLTPPLYALLLWDSCADLPDASWLP